MINVPYHVHARERYSGTGSRSCYSGCVRMTLMPKKAHRLCLRSTNNGVTCIVSEAGGRLKDD